MSLGHNQIVGRADFHVVEGSFSLFAGLCIYLLLVMSNRSQMSKNMVILCLKVKSSDYVIFEKVSYFQNQFSYFSLFPGGSDDWKQICQISG